MFSLCYENIMFAWRFSQQINIFCNAVYVRTECNVIGSVHNTRPMHRKFNSDGQQFHQYQQN